MNNKFSAKIIPYAIFTSILLTACGKKSGCTITFDHAHKYTKQITSDIEIEKYLCDEHLHVGGYDWDENFIKLTEEEKEFYATLKKKKLFDGASNWDYLYYEMLNNRDYLEFYYEYTTTETYTTTDEDGDVHLHTREVTEDGWTQDPYYHYNTGKVRVCHHQYYGYKVVMNNNKYKLEKSPLVDDIREIIDEYPYFGENNVTIVNEKFKYRKGELPNLKLEDLDPFNQPDLENRELTPADKTLKKSL